VQSPLFAGPKYRKPKMASHDLRARSFEDDYLCSILHGPLQLQIWMAFPLPACLFHTVARQLAIHLLTHPSLNYLSLPKDYLHLHASVPISSLFLDSTLPSSLFRPSSSPPQAGSRRYNPSNAASPPLCGCSQFVRFGRRYAYPGRQICLYPNG
jgi:hypothetical protein